MENVQKSYTFTHRADCVLRLVDTTTGRTLEPGAVRLYSGGGLLRPVPKPGGWLVFMNTERRDMRVDIEADGFERQAVELVFDADDRVPLMRDVHLLPQPDNGGERFEVLAGKKKALLAVDAVLCGENACLAREFEKRRRVLRVFNPHRLELDMLYYAIVDPESGSYEALEIETRLSDTEFVLARPLEKPVSPHFPLARRVLGRVEPGGAYRLVLRRSAGRRWLVRRQTEEGESFETVDLDEGPTTGQREGDGT